MPCIAPYDLFGVFRPRSPSFVRPVLTRSDQFGASTKLRQALALPVYTVALVLDYLSGALGVLAASIAGDDWPS